MAFLIGTDEAGYGPNLGPLIISASVWEIPDDGEGDDLYARLATVVTRTVPRTKRAAEATLAIADSKSLYQSGKGLKLLERGLWAAWDQLGRRPATCGEAWEALGGPDCSARHGALCGGCDGHAAPCDAHLPDIDALGSRLRDALAAAGVRLVDLRSVAVYPRAFNEAVEQCDSKGTALSRWTLRLLADAIAPLDDARIAVLCDKHGGRDRYLPLLCEAFPDRFIEVCEEGRGRSVYRFGPPQRQVEVGFQAKGESHLPTALASMASKYLRELAMHAFNAFWRQHLPGIRPTAGYPEDARRFRSEIAAAQQALGIPDTMIWRTR